MVRVRVQVPVDQLAASHKPQQEPTMQPSAAVNRFTKTQLALALCVVMVLGLIVFLINDRSRLKTEIKQQGAVQTNTANDALKYQEEIGKIVELPTGQTPSVIPVSDAAKLASENAFFKNATNGDIVLLYVSPDKSVRAVLYRPSTKKVVEATSSATIGTSTSTQP